MKLAFCLYKYFPYGGLQRDLLRIAEACHRRGAAVRVYTFEWQGDCPHWLELCRVPKKGWSSPARNRHFTDWVLEHCRQQPVDCLVGFNKMPGLDVYYAADGCYEARVSELYGRFYRMTARYRHFSRYETAVFGTQSRTEILMISRLQMPVFQRYYQTQNERLHLLPPGIARDRIAAPDSPVVRQQLRHELGLSDDERLLLMVGSGFKTKGVDRSIEALAALPQSLRDKTRLLVIGQDNPASLTRLARQRGVADRFQVLAGRDDVPHFMQAADLLIHPARHENTGTVLLEAVVAGLPVLVTDVCGYAHYVQEAEMGQVLRSPFSQTQLDQALTGLLQAVPANGPRWRQRGAAFAASADIYSMPEVAAKHILGWAQGAA